MRWNSKRDQYKDEYNKETCSAHFNNSPDDLIRSRKHVRRDCEADLLGRFQIDDELELGWLLDGEVSGLGSFQYLIDVSRGTPELFPEVGGIGHESTNLDEHLAVINRWDAVFLCELYDAFSLIEEQKSQRHYETLETIMDNPGKHVRQSVGGAHLYGSDLDTQGLGGHLCIFL
jgi:hypothetical protein